MLDVERDDNNQCITHLAWARLSCAVKHIDGEMVAT
jgi:hypothetical protein